MNLTTLLRRFSIRTRMLGAIGLVLLLLCGVGGIGLVELRQQQGSAERLSSHLLNQSGRLGALRGAVGDLRRFEKDLIINAERAPELAAYRDKWRDAMKRATSHAEAMLAGPPDAQDPILRQLQPRLAAYGREFENATRDIGAGSTAVALNDALKPAKAEIHAAEKLLGDLAASIEADGTQARDELAAAGQRTLWVLGAVLAVAMAVVVPLTLANMASICRPIDDARRLAERIAAGDLGGRVDQQGADETARLLAALAAMQSSLHGIVGQVREASESIQVASAEVAAGNTDLSQRTEQAASNLQQTASSMTQLNANVRQSADAAAQANQLASSAASVAQRGGEVVSQVVSTMDQINQSSKKISDIIGTIDGIAFQTNILALNAAVEAARAGEQGRGFAVVAGEVRSLAGRSAEAAREIKSLIGANVDRVENGMRLVQDAGSTMSEIVTSVQRVTDIIGEISAAAAEQSGGIGQVNHAVVQLDQMTQQNAALVEQSAAAAESLREQAARLSQTVATFRLEGGGGAPVVLAAASSPVAANPTAAAPKATPPAAAPKAAARAPKLAAAAPVAAGSPAVAEPRHVVQAEQAIAKARAAEPAAPAPSPPAPGRDDGDWESF